jgi:hypothetical protein
MTLDGIVEHAEMGGWLVAFDVLSWTKGTQPLLDQASRWAEHYGVDGRIEGDERDRLVERARFLAERISRWIPGTRCLHRALASRVWLARRGVESEVVVGFRKGGGLEGHAWLEAQGAAGLLRAFFDAEAGWREVLRG